jgi:large subunit ribosomal protein MRP49
MLPRIKYRNPSIPITIARHTDPNGPSLLHIYTKPVTPLQTPPSNPSTHAPPSATPNAQTTLVPDTSAPTHTLNIRDQQESEILEALVKQTGATEIQPTEQETQEMAELAEFKERSEKDRVFVREGLLRERREAELLKVARGEVPVVN